jgi:tetratricopeptide (TPR) repeat protein
VEQARSANDETGERTALQSLLKQDPHDVPALERLAALARAEGRWSEAAGYWAQVARFNPLHEGARFEQARNLAAAGDVAALLDLLGQAGASPSAPEQVLVARALMMRGDLKGARERSQAALTADPSLPAARLLGADIAFADGDDAGAGATYRGLLADAEAKAAANLGLAQLAMRAGDSAGALAQLSAMGSVDGFQALEARAQLYRQLERLDLAEADLRTLLAKYGPIPDAVVPLAELRAGAGDRAGVHQLRLGLTGGDTPSLAARHYLQALEEYLGGNLTSARDYLGWAGELYGGRDLYRWVRLDLGARLGDPGLSAPAVESMRRGVLGQTRRNAAAALLASQAATRADAGEVRVAAELARQALDLVPGLPAAQIVLARTALIGGDAKGAREQAAALADDPRWRPLALELLGRAALDLDDLEGAERYFDLLAATDPKAAAPLYWQGLVDYRQGELAAAEGRLAEADRRRSDPRIEAALIDVLIARADWTQAEALARRVAELKEPQDRARGLAYLGGLHRAQGRVEEAAADYRKAFETDPGRSPYALTAADLEIARKGYGAARAILERAATRHPDNRYIAFKLALVDQLDGQGAEAISRYRLLLALTPDWALPMVNLSELLAGDPATRPESLRLAERAADLTPDWTDSRWNLAQRQAEAGANALAVAAARQVLAHAPDHAGAAELVARLGQSQ